MRLTSLKERPAAESTSVVTAEDRAGQKSTESRIESKENEKDIKVILDRQKEKYA